MPLKRIGWRAMVFHWQKAGLRGLLPAAAGIATATLLIPTHREGAVPGSEPLPAIAAYRETVGTSRTLADDPQAIRFAALAGRKAEAVRKLQEALAAGADDKTLAEWLAPVLIGDPGWLETFLASLPEERRAGLAEWALNGVVDLQPEAVWEILRCSPTALAVFKKPADARNRDLMRVAIFSGPSVDHLLDPALGFSDEEIARPYRYGAFNQEDCRRLLEEWVAGRWRSGETPPFLGSVWQSLAFRDPQALERIKSTLPAELAGTVAGYERLMQLSPGNEGITRDPTAAELRELRPEQINALYQTGMESGRPIPLETLAQLPDDLRRESAINVMEYLSTYNPERVEQVVAGLDSLKLPDDEKQGMLADAVQHQWQRLGDFDTALAWSARLTDPAKRDETQAEIMKTYVSLDPAGAQQRGEAMPPGPLRDATLKAARDAAP